MKKEASSIAPKVAADTGTVARVAMLLRLIAERQGAFTLTDIANASNLPAPTVHRLLDLLAQQGLVAHEKSQRSYCVGTELYRISSLVRVNVPLVQLVRPVLADAAREADESCYFALYLPAQPAVMYESRVDSSHSLDYRIQFNHPMSLLWGSSGRAILAHVPADRLQAALDNERNFSPGGALPDVIQLHEELRLIRERGYAFSHGQRIPGAVGILAPVFDENQRIFGALGFTIPAQRFQEEKLELLAQSAMSHANQLSRALGSEARSLNSTDKERR
ncbi:IclR family transcriptional regulator [Polaromonas sp.]|uniref:IclR family transcriptional regulator n=1 Tax=Polaromonas sp. TaxID=1869339 RepID=UPI0032648772